MIVVTIDARKAMASLGRMATDRVVEEAIRREAPLVQARVQKVPRPPSRAKAAKHAAATLKKPQARRAFFGKMDAGTLARATVGVRARDAWRITALSADRLTLSNTAPHALYVYGVGRRSAGQASIHRKRWRSAAAVERWAAFRLRRAIRAAMIAAYSAG